MAVSQNSRRSLQNGPQKSSSMFVPSTGKQRRSLLEMSTAACAQQLDIGDLISPLQPMQPEPRKSLQGSFSFKPKQAWENSNEVKPRRKSQRRFSAMPALTSFVKSAVEEIQSGGGVAGGGSSSRDLLSTTPNRKTSRTSKTGDVQTNQHLRGLRMRIINPELLRAVPAELALGGWGEYWRSNQGPKAQAAQDLFKLSSPCTTFDDFLSHSWHAPFWKKYLALLLVYNSKGAACFATIWACLIFVLKVSNVFDTNSRDAEDDFAPWCLVGAQIIFATMFRFYVAMKSMLHVFPSSRCFFDKLCIHQGDANLMAEGIDSIGGFLANAQRMVIFWSPEYFTRLWCTFEIAAFFQLHGARDEHSAEMLFLPLGLAVVLLGLFVCIGLAALLWEIIPVETLVAGELPNAFHLVVLSLVLLCFCAWILLLARLLQTHMRERFLLSDQLSKFSILNCKSGREDDVKRIHRTIGRWHLDEDHGDIPFHVREAMLLDPNEVSTGLSIFDDKIHAEFRWHILSAVGKESSIKFRYAVTFVSFPLIWMGLDLHARSHREDPMIVELFLKLCSAFLWAPLCARLLLHCTYRLTRRGDENSRATFQYVALLFVVAFISVVSVVFQSVMNELPIWAMCVVVFVLYVVTKRFYPDAPGLASLIRLFTGTQKGLQEEVKADFVTKGPTDDLYCWQWVDGDPAAMAKQQNATPHGLAPVNHRGSCFVPELPKQKREQIIPLCIPWTIEDLRKLLTAHNFDVDAAEWVDNQALHKLGCELSRGACKLVKTQEKLSRVVHVVAVRLVNSEGKILVELSPQINECSGKASAPHLPGARRFPNESVLGLARRLLEERAGLDPWTYELNWDMVERVETTRNSTSYPGIPTISHMHIAQAKMNGDDDLFQSQSTRRHESLRSLKVMGDSFFEWWTEESLLKVGSKVKGRPWFSLEGFDKVPTPWTSEDLSSLLERHNVPVSQLGVGKAKSLSAMEQELWSGECYFIRDERRLIRVVEVLMFRIVAPGGEVLVEESVKEASGKVRNKGKLPAAKRRPEEEIWTTIRRLLSTELSVIENVVSVSKESLERHDESKESPSYPGMQCLYRTWVISAALVPEKDPDASGRLGLSELRCIMTQEESLDGPRTRSWAWWSEDRCTEKKVPFAAKQGADGVQNVADEENSTAICWTEENVQDILDLHSMPTHMYGSGSAKSVADLAQELRNQDCYFLSDNSGALKRVEELVLLRLTNDDTVLVVSATGHGKACLPWIRRRADEDVWAASRRLVGEKLCLQESDVSLIRKQVEVIDSEGESSEAYPGLPNFQRTYIIGAELVNKDSSPSQQNLRWWSEDACLRAQMLLHGAKQTSLEGYGFQKVPTPWTPEDLQILLNKHGIDTSQFGTGSAKSMDDMEKELRRGECYLMRDASELIRVVDTVLLRIFSPQGQVLLEMEERFANGRIRTKRKLPGAKRRPEENVWATARRVLLTELRMPDSAFDVKPGQLERRDNQKDSPSYPGIRTFYSNFIIEATLDADFTSEVFYEFKEKYALGERDASFETVRLDGRRCLWQWWDPEEVQKLGIDEHSQILFSFEGMRHVTVPWGPRNLTHIFQMHNIDPDGFDGTDGSKTLAQVAKELLDSEFYLAEGMGPGLTRVVDVVVLKLFSPEPEQRVLYEVERRLKTGGRRVRKQLPGARRQETEGVYDTARRILAEVLKMPEAMCNIDRGSVIVDDERIWTAAYPGLPSLYRKHIVEINIVTKDEHALKQFGLSLPKDEVSADTGRSSIATWRFLTAVTRPFAHRETSEETNDGHTSAFSHQVSHQFSNFFNMVCQSSEKPNAYSSNRQNTNFTNDSRTQECISEDPQSSISGSSGRFGGFFSKLNSMTHKHSENPTDFEQKGGSQRFSFARKWLSHNGHDGDRKADPSSEEVDDLEPPGFSSRFQSGQPGSKAPSIRHLPSNASNKFSSNRALTAPASAKSSMRHLPSNASNGSRMVAPFDGNAPGEGSEDMLFNHSASVRPVRSDVSL